MPALHELGLVEARDAIAARRLGAVEYCRALLDRIGALDPSLSCFLQVMPEEALRRAAEIDGRIGRGEAVGPLAGVPVALKDNICLDRGRTTCGCRMLENYESPYSATAARKLEEAGAVIVGKTNLDEFAMGSSTENSAFQKTRNPWDVSRVPGGSSGGSAAAVAARLVPGALGSDTGGSVRQPAGLCGIVGVKPTYGRVSRWGLVAYASSLDQIGCLARAVPDAAALLDAICGFDDLDSTSANLPPPRASEGIEAPVKGLRLGVPKEARSSANHPEVSAAFEKAIEVFRSLGATIVDVELPNLPHAIAAYYTVATAEASSNLARFDGIRYGRRAALKPGEGLEELYARSRAEGFGPEVRRRIMLGTFVLSSGYYDAYYVTALKVRRLIKGDFDRVFGSGGQGGCHAMLTPTTVNPAFRFGEFEGNPLAMYLEDLYTVTANLAGIPGASVPAGFASQGDSQLPIGLQVLGPAFEEGRLLRIARQFERATGWGKAVPSIAAGSGI